MKILSLLLAATSLFAGQTRTWTQGDSADFEKGILKNLSLRSDGRLSLAPVSRELFDTASSYLWALAQDSKGTLYAGGGTSAKLYRIPLDGKGKVVADLDALEIHAIAIDSKDRVYAATSPDGKIYRITGNGKPEVFYDPKAKYIWALAFDAAGNLFVATGDQGEIHRVTPDGKGRIFFKTEETHVRSMTIDGKGNLIAGTEPGGLVLRVSPAGDGFVLYQMAKKEVTAVAVAPDGAIYAAAVGNRQSSPPTTPAPPPVPAQVQVTTGPGAAQPPRQPSPPVASLTPTGVAGGSELYRIDPDGVPRRVWSHATDVVYAIAFDAGGRALLAAGNRGNLYRVESPTLYTGLLVMPATQVTALQMGAGGRLYAATGNAGKVFEVGPALESTGSVESDVFDSGSYSLWGRVTPEVMLNGGQLTLATRSGNLDQPQKNWSAWTPVAAGPKGGRSASPAARFVQWKATFTGAEGRSPELDSVDLAYLPKNLEPRIDEIETTPPNYRFPASSVSALSVIQSTLSLPPLGKHSTTSGGPQLTLDTTPAMQSAKGFLGARWSALDPNGDPLVFTVEIRGVKEAEWKLLKDKVNEKYLSWDSTAFPDGEYRIRVTASDAPGNPSAEVLTARLESSPFWIDNTPPKITGLAGVRIGSKLQLKWHAADALNNIAKAEYSVDGGDWKIAPPVTRLSDSQELDYELALDAGPGEHTVAVRVEDDYANQAVEKVVVH
uniref:YD repeat protein n=1 Tax=Solibacter usitatus (strain Ellin6076) TaxID=234267 RepID=Q01QH4_SOLUE